MDEIYGKYCLCKSSKYDKLPQFLQIVGYDFVNKVYIGQIPFEGNSLYEQITNDMIQKVFNSNEVIEFYENLIEKYQNILKIFDTGKTKTDIKYAHLNYQIELSRICSSYKNTERQLEILKRSVKIFEKQKNEREIENVKKECKKAEKGIKNFKKRFFFFFGEDGTSIMNFVKEYPYYISIYNIEGMTERKIEQLKDRIENIKKQTNIL